MSKKSYIDYLRSLSDEQLRGYARQLSRYIPLAQSRLILAQSEIKTRIRAAERATEAAAPELEQPEKVCGKVS